MIVIETTVTGIGVLIWSGKEPQCIACGFLPSWHVQQWAAGRVELQGSPVLHRYANARFGRPPDWRRVGGSKPFLEHQS